MSMLITMIRNPKNKQDIVKKMVEEYGAAYLGKLNSDQLELYTADIDVTQYDFCVPRFDRLLCQFLYDWCFYTNGDALSEFFDRLIKVLKGSIFNC